MSITSQSGETLFRIRDQALINSLHGHLRMEAPRGNISFQRSQDASAPAMVKLIGAKIDAKIHGGMNFVEV